VTDRQKQAFEDFKKGLSYSEIAAKNGIPVSTVKTWAARYFKAKEVSKKSETTETIETDKDKKKKPPPREKGGANNVKHGAYENVTWEVLEDDYERALIEQIDYTPEEILKNNYKNLLLRERRLQKKILEYKEKSKHNQNLILGSVTKIKGINGPIEDKTITVAESESNTIKIYETELTKIQAQQIKIAIELKKMTLEDKGDEDGIVDDWVNEVIANDEKS
jgi:uncharacterized protein YjcR